MNAFVLTLLASNIPYDVLLNSPELYLQFCSKQVGRVLFFILDKLLYIIICLFCVDNVKRV